MMISREELHRLVWSKPMNQIAEQFDVSVFHLGQVCKALKVPRPAPGYWNKLAVGRAPDPEPLPKIYANMPSEWDMPRAVQSSSPPKPKRRMKAVNEGAPSQSRIHPLIRGAREHFLGGRSVEENEYLRPAKRLLPDISASRRGIDKALELTNALFTALEAKRHPVFIAEAKEEFRGISVDERENRTGEPPRYFGYGRWSPMRPTVVRLKGAVFGLSIVEMSEEVLLRYVAGKYVRDDEVTPQLLRRINPQLTWTSKKAVPSGRLRLIAYSPYALLTWQKDWQDTAKRSLADQIPVVVRALEREAVAFNEKLNEARRQAEIERKKREEEWERYRRKEDQRRIEQSFKESRDHLDKVIEQWSQVMNMERFFAGVEQRAQGLNEEERTVVLQRLDLAREIMGTQDPLDFLRAWKSPLERYKPRYNDEECV